MGLKNMVATLGERYGAFSALQRYKLRESLVAEVPQVWVTRIAGVIAPILEIALGHHPKRPDGRDRSTVLTIEFVPLVTIQHDFAIEVARQLDAVEEYVSRIEVTVPAIAIAVTIAEVAWIVPVALESRHAIQRYPGGLDVADVVITIAVTRIEIHATSRNVAVNATAN